MNTLSNFAVKIGSATLALALLAGCSPSGSNAGGPTDAIDRVRASLALPDLPLEFVENGYMANSPSGNLPVANYRDGEGRLFSVDPQTNRVVEIDARALLPGRSADTPTLPLEEIRARALKFAKAVVPGFAALQSSLRYEEGGKVDNYFFNWYDESQPVVMMRPFLQFGFHKSGLLFAYYNTLSLEK